MIYDLRVAPWPIGACYHGHRERSGGGQAGAAQSNEPVELICELCCGLLVTHEHGCLQSYGQSNSTGCSPEVTAPAFPPPPPRSFDCVRPTTVPRRTPLRMTCILLANHR